jgi:hypothetical protein
MDWLDRTCALAAPITLDLGIKQTRTLFAEQSPNNLATLTADTTISADFPLTLPITF